jgi:predicted transcriptional regulator
MSKAIIEGLEEYKLLEPTSDSNREYVTSPKGKEYLQKFNELEEIIYKNSTYTKKIPR